GTGNTPDQSVEVVGNRLGRRWLYVIPLTAQKCDVAPDEFANLTLESRHSRLFGLGPFRRSPVRSINLRTGFFRNCPVRTRPLRSVGRHGRPLLQMHKILRDCAPVGADCRTRLRRPWGKSAKMVKAFHPNLAGSNVMHGFENARRGIQQPAYQFNLKPAVMLLLLVVCPTSVTAVVTCRGP